MLLRPIMSQGFGAGGLAVFVAVGILAAPAMWAAVDSPQQPCSTCNRLSSPGSLIAENNINNNPNADVIPKPLGPTGSAVINNENGSGNGNGNIGNFNGNANQGNGNGNGNLGSYNGNYNQGNGYGNCMVGNGHENFDRAKHFSFQQLDNCAPADGSADHI